MAISRTHLLVIVIALVALPFLVWKFELGVESDDGFRLREKTQHEHDVEWEQIRRDAKARRQREAWEPYRKEERRHAKLRANTEQGRAAIREQVLQTILSSPGATATEIAQRVGTELWNVNLANTRLLSERKIRVERASTGDKFFPSTGR